MIEDINVLDAVDSIVQDLKNKTNELYKLVESIAPEKREAIKSIVNKTVGVLNNASNKVVESAQVFDDSQEVIKGIEIVKNKSQELYDNAVSKIKEIISEKVQNAVEIPTIKNKVSNEIPTTNEQIFNDSEVEVSEASITSKSIKVLKDWLRPDGV